MNYQTSGNAKCKIPTTNKFINASGNIGTANKALNGTWTPGSAVYGGPTDTWGETWTGADIQSPNFGWVLSVNTARTPGNFNDFFAIVDCGRVQVCYVP